MEKILSPVLDDLSPERVAAAVEENMIAWMPVFGMLGEYREDAPPGVKRSITKLPSSLINSIAGAQLDTDHVDAAIKAVIESGRTLNIPMQWWTGPLTQPVDIGNRLVEHGFSNNGDSPGMAFDLALLGEDLPVVDGLMVERPQDEAACRVWTDTALRAFGVKEVKPIFLDAWSTIIREAGPALIRAYTGWWMGQPVATSLLFLGAGVAGIYWVGTLPEARKKGFGTRLTLEALHDARRSGYRISVLGASEMGCSVYRAIGFKTVCTMGAYTWRP